MGSEEVAETGSSPSMTASMESERPTSPLRICRASRLITEEVTEMADAAEVSRTEDSQLLSRPFDSRYSVNSFCFERQIDI